MGWARGAVRAAQGEERPLPQDFRADPQLYEACKDDASTLCKDVKFGGGRVQACLVRRAWADGAGRDKGRVREVVRRAVVQCATRHATAGHQRGCLGLV